MTTRCSLRKRGGRIAGSLLLLSTAVAQHAQAVTAADAFNEGKAFATPQSAAAAQGVTSAAGQNSVPGYNTSAPQSSLYNTTPDGAANLSSAGTAKQAACKSSVAPNAYQQQECDAVNFISQNPSQRVKFTIDSKTDPVVAGSQAMISNPGTAASNSSQQCHVLTKKTPGTTSTEYCEQTSLASTHACYTTVNPVCNYGGSPISSSSLSQSGIFQTLSLTPAGSPGLYNYVVNLPSCLANADGSAEIDFNLDTIGRGSYITINLSNLDDAAAIGVNGYTVFAGYPNAGPAYSGSFFPQTSQAFQIGYSWTEKYRGVNRNYYANTKVMDACPAGYGRTYQTTETYTPYHVMGFFCNSQGKFLMNRHEGSGEWSGTVSAKMPLVKGLNKIQIYWGTGYWDNACGGVTVTGQIYNVAPQCQANIDDQCASMKAAQ